MATPSYVGPHMITVLNPLQAKMLAPHIASKQQKIKRALDVKWALWAPVRKTGKAGQTDPSI
jgi:hypothetical protein